LRDVITRDPNAAADQLPTDMDHRHGMRSFVKGDQTAGARVTSGRSACIAFASGLSE
jgi:hypothetical protein